MRPLALAIVFIAACGTGDAGTKSRHAIVIGLDGVRVDALERASTPRIDELIAEGTVSYDGIRRGRAGDRDSAAYLQRPWLEQADSRNKRPLRFAPQAT